MLNTMRYKGGVHGNEFNIEDSYNPNRLVSFFWRFSSKISFLMKESNGVVSDELDELPCLY
jgi:hypothetical protein